MKNDNKCFLYVVKMALHYEVIKKHLQRISRIKPFLSKYNWKWINYPSGKDIGKNVGKIIQQLLLMCYTLRNEYICCIYFKKQTNSWKPNHYFNDSKQRRMKLYCNKKTISTIKRITLNLHEKLSTTKIDEPILCRYLMPTIWTFDGIENKNDVYWDTEPKITWKSFVNP